MEGVWWLGRKRRSARFEIVPPSLLKRRHGSREVGLVAVAPQGIRDLLRPGLDQRLGGLGVARWGRRQRRADDEVGSRPHRRPDSLRGSEQPALLLYLAQVDGIGRLDALAQRPQLVEHPTHRLPGQVEHPAGSGALRAEREPQ